MSDFQYVNSTNGQIFIDGILLDDCYDIQYSYRETKEPIYGYNSKFFDKVVDGNVIIHGSFTINYRHDRYLYALLKKVRNDREDPKAKSPIDKIKDFKNSERDYKTGLLEYKSLQAKVKENKRSLLREEGILTGIENQISGLEDERINTNNNFDAQILSKNNDKDNIYLIQNNQDGFKRMVESYKVIENSYNTEKALIKNSIDEMNSDVSKWNNEIGDLSSQITSDKNQEEIKTIQSKIDILQTQIDTVNGYLDDSKQQYAQKEDEKQQFLNSHYSEDVKRVIGIESDITQLKEDKNSYNSNYEILYAFLNQQYTSKNEDIKSLKTQIAEDKGFIDTFGNYLSSLKNKIDNVIDLWNDSTLNIDTKGERAEDLGPFDIYLVYNGEYKNQGKIIRRCYILGHSHVLENGGPATKEYYQFLAHHINDQK